MAKHYQSIPSTSAAELIAKMAVGRLFKEEQQQQSHDWSTYIKYGVGFCVVAGLVYGVSKLLSSDDDAIADSTFSMNIK